MRFQRSFAVAGCALMACMAAPILAYEIETDAEKTIVGWFEAAACALPQKQFMDKLVSDHGIARSELMAARRALSKAGLIERGADRTLTLSGVGSCGGSGASTASASADDPRARVMAMFEANACSLSGNQLSDVAAQFQVTRKQYRLIARAMEEAGDLSEEGSRITLKVGDICGERRSRYEPANADERLVITMFEENGCALTEEQMPALGAQYGIGREAFRAAGRAMDAEGLFREEGETVILLGGACAEDIPATEADAPEREEPLPELDTRARIIGVFEGNECRLTEALALKQFPEAGLDMDRDFQVIDQMFEKGEIIEGVGDVAILVIGDKCAVDFAAMKQAVIAAFARNGCVLTEETLETAMAESGFDGGDASEMVETMIESGEIAFDAATQKARLLIGGACGK